jgi:RimJ/RimL family protein N-acetyltransferase
MTLFTHFLPETQIVQYGSWLKSLDPETLRNYFGISLNTQGIHQLVTKFKEDRVNHHFLIAEQNQQWVGVIHIACMADAVEFGVIVKKEFRRQGIANQLLGEAMTWAQNRGFQKLYMHCVVENQAIRQLCHQHGLIAKNRYGDIQGEMSLPKPTWRSLYKEYFQRQTNWFYFLRGR